MGRVDEGEKVDAAGCGGEQGGRLEGWSGCGGGGGFGWMWS